jgi:DNA-binding NarL/FixJ family response regulator
VHLFSYPERGGTDLPHPAVLKVALRQRPNASEVSAEIMLLLELGVLVLAQWRVIVDERKLLTDIECKVLDCAAEGMTVDQTAALRGVSRNTIMIQRRNVLRKIGAKNMAQAIAKAFELGLLGTP